MAAVTEKRGFHFPFGIRHLTTLPASSRSGYVTPVTLGAEEGSFGHHAPLHTCTGRQASQGRKTVLADPAQGPLWDI